MKQGMGYNSGHRNTRVNSKSQVQPIYWRGFVNLCGIHFEDLPNLYILKYINKWNNGTWQSEVSDSTSYSLLTVRTFFRWNGLYLVITGIFGPPENGTHNWSFYWGLSGVFPYGTDGWAGAWFSWGRGQVTDSLYQRHVGVTEGSSREVTVDILSYLWQSMIISDEVPVICILIHRKHLWCKAQTAPVNTLNRKPQQKHCS